MKIGDNVRVDGMTGVVVGLPAENAWAAGYPAEEWDFLGEGVLVDTGEAGLVHFPDARRLTVEGQHRP